MTELILLAVLLGLMILNGRALSRLSLHGKVALALFIALGSLGRGLTASLPPGIQPASLLIMMAGFLLGPGAGLIAGVLTALLSNLLISLGPFVPWQMFFWGLMGLSARKKIPLWLRPVLGFAWGFFFGWGTNFSMFTYMPFSWEAYLASCVGSFNVDLIHGITNAVLLTAVGVPIETYFHQYFKRLTVHKNK